LQPSQYGIEKSHAYSDYGSGAAGLSAAKELLASDLPVKIDIIEKNIVNPVRLDWR